MNDEVVHTVLSFAPFLLLSHCYQEAEHACLSSLSNCVLPFMDKPNVLELMVQDP